MAPLPPHMYHIPHIAQSRKNDNQKTFPKTSNWLTPNLNKIQTGMKVKGIQIVTGEHNSQGRRIIKIINHNL